VSRLAFGSGLALFVLAWHLVPWGAAFIEQHYARGLYPRIATLLVPLADGVAFSLSAVLLGALALLALLWLAWGWQRGGVGKVVRRKLGDALLAALAAYVLFVFLWGANYQRQSVETLLALELSPVSAEEVEGLAEALAALVVALEPEMQRDAASALASLREALQEVVAEVTGVTPPLPTRVKQLSPGTLIGLGASGFISPWLLEPHVERALPEPFKLAVAAHELAHVAGFAGEADADLIAALAGLQASDPYARYATALKLFSDSLTALSPPVREALLGALPEAARRELTDLRQALTRYQRPWLATLSRLAYDRYLQTQGVEAGVGDYGRTIMLLVQASRPGARLTPQLDATAR
jgi:hypothetical protein